MQYRLVARQFNSQKLLVNQELRSRGIQICHWI